MQGNEFTEEKVLTIEVPPGTNEGTQYIFPREGNHSFYSVPADIIFITRDKRHNIFKRDGSNLEYTAYLTKQEFTEFGTLSIPTLENQNITFSLSEIINPKNAVKRFAGFGLTDPSK